jgi:hypothetical protein
MATIPSGSFNAAGFLLYDATLSSGYCIEDQQHNNYISQKLPLATSRHLLLTDFCQCVRPNKRIRV